jgi:hypothetical protein
MRGQLVLVTGVLIDLSGVGLVKGSSLLSIMGTSGRLGDYSVIDDSSLRLTNNSFRDNAISTMGGERPAANSGVMAGLSSSTL